MTRDGVNADRVSPNYYIESDAARVVAWSTAPIQFEPRGWRLDFRRDLRLAVAKLPLQQ